MQKIFWTCGDAVTRARAAAATLQRWTYTQRHTHLCLDKYSRPRATTVTHALDSYMYADLRSAIAICLPSCYYAFHFHAA